MRVLLWAVVGSLTVGCGGSKEESDSPTDQCEPSAQGHPIQPEGIVTVGLSAIDESGDRLMQHPRNAYRVGDALVSCNSDHIGIFHVSNIDWIYGDRAIKDAPDFEPDYAQTEIALAGLRHCENLLIDEARSLIVTSSRGTFGDQGGIASWRLPDVSQQKPSPAKFLSSIKDSAGFSGIALAGDILYAARYPNTLSVFRLEAGGQLTALTDYVVPDMLSAGQLLLDGDRVYLSDPARHEGTIKQEVTSTGEGMNHLGQTHVPGGGRVFAIDVSTPNKPELLGWADTAGASRGLTALPHHVIAVAVGTEGVQLFDFSNSKNPMLIGTIDTPRSVTSVSYDNDYLLVADWNMIRLYDASEPTSLKQVDGTEVPNLLRLHTELDEEDLKRFGNDAPVAMRHSLKAASWVQMKDNRFIVCELDAIVLGQITPENKAARINVHTPLQQIRQGKKTITATIENAGSLPLCLTVDSSNQITVDNDSLVMAAGEMTAIEMTLADNFSQKQLRLSTNDPHTPVGYMEILLLDKGYELGDKAPPFTLPVINECSANTCSTEPKCVTSKETLDQGKPMLLAFFSSW